MSELGRESTARWCCRQAICLAVLLTGLSGVQRGLGANEGPPILPQRLPAVEGALGNRPVRTAAGESLEAEASGMSLAASDDQQEAFAVAPSAPGEWQTLPAWIEQARVGYDRGFVIASSRSSNLQADDLPFLLRINGLLQLRQTHFESTGPNRDLNQYQLIRGRLAFSGHAINPDLGYFVQLDGRSSAGDEFRLLDYIMDYDFGHRQLGMEKRALVFKAGKYKVPFTLSRYLSAREFEFSDRSVASMYFDVNRSLAWGLYGQATPSTVPIEWEMALFNGLVTGGSETGSSGALDNNIAYSARVAAFPTGDWGNGALADLDWHESPATRIGAAFAGTAIAREGPTEFDSIRVVDSGLHLSTLLPLSVHQFDVQIYAVDASCKYQGWSLTSEYYVRAISDFEGGSIPTLLDHGFWFQLGKFVVPGKLELISRWSRVEGDSGTLGLENQSADEIAGGFVWYFHGQNAKLTCDATHLDGAPISASSLDIFPGDRGWLFRTQIQLAF